MQIFISAVTSEFGKARDQVGADLRARGHDITIQSDFQQSPDSETLLDTLSDYIRDCHAVICIVGTRSGACPPKAAADRLANTLPAGILEASYTQWEFFLARYFKRRPYLYIANNDYKPDLNKPPGRDRPELQSAYRQHLTDQGPQYSSFSNVDQLARAVLRDEPKIVADPAPVRQTVAKPIVLPYPSIGKLFKGRDEFLQRLHASLTSGGQTAITSQALYGLGGIGKTRVAVEYAWTHADDYNALLFVIAETPEALRRNLAALASTLVPMLDTTDDEVRLKAVLDWLNCNPGWFLILDNVDKAEALAEAESLLSQLRGGHVVITSRLSNFAAHVEPLELDVLTADDATDFLLDRTKRRRRVAADDEAKAREVAGELGRLALALEQAGAYIAKQRLTFDEYLQRWRSKRDEILSWFDATVTGYPRSVAVTWQTSVAQLSEPGLRTLERLAWLAPEKIPEALLEVEISGVEAPNTREAFDELSAYSLVTRDAEGPFFLVHRLVQDITRRSLEGEARQRSLTQALNWINAAFAGNAVDVRSWPRLTPLGPHARAVTEHADAAGISEPTARLMNQLGLLLNEKALHAEAEPLMRRALAISEKGFGPDHPQVAIHLSNLSQLLHDTDRLAEAEPLMRRALAIGEAGPDDPTVAIRLNNLAQLLQATNRPAEAEPLMRRALAIGEADPDAPNVAIRLNNLAVLLVATHRLVEAEPLYRRALAIEEKSFGPDHPEVASTLNNLAELLRATDRLAEAEPLMRRALTIVEKSFGPDHPKVAIGLNNLAGLLQATNRLAEAEPLYRRALAIDEATYGPDHPDVATDLNNLAAFLRATNRLGEAEPLMRRHVEIFVEFTRRTGHPHPHLNATFENYSILLEAMGKSPSEIEAAIAELKRPLP